MKRIAVFILSLALILSFAVSCGSEAVYDPTGGQRGIAYDYKRVDNLYGIDPQTPVRVIGCFVKEESENGEDRYFCYTSFGGDYLDGFEFYPVPGTFDFSELAYGATITVKGVCVQVKTEFGKTENVLRDAIVEKGVH